MGLEFVAVILDKRMYRGLVIISKNKNQKPWKFKVKVAFKIRTRVEIHSNNTY